MDIKSLKDKILQLAIQGKLVPQDENDEPASALLAKIRDHDRKKRSFTKYRAWQKYCRVAERKGLKAYRKSRFYKLYYNFFHHLMTALRGKFGENLQEIRAFEIARNKIIKLFA